MRPLLPLALAGLAAAALGACAPRPGPAELSGPIEAVELGTIKNLHAIDGLYLAGQPAPDDWALVQERGVKTVLNIRKDDEQELDERAAVEALGLTYVHLPWNGPEELTDEVFEQGRELLNTLERPVLFHCGSANRVGAMWVPWRVLDGGIPLEEALAEAKTIGLRTPAYEALAIDYVTRRR